MNKLTVELFIQKLAIQGKTGVKLPKKELEAKREKDFLLSLLGKELMSKSLCESMCKEIDSITLSDDMYNDFYEIIRSRVQKENDYEKGTC